MIKPPKYFSEIAYLISKLYPDAKKIVEVGVGRSPYAAIQLKMLLPRAEIVVTDMDRDALRYVSSLNLNAVYDDVSRPKLEIYEGADVIYSIRPPPELIYQLEELGIRVGADILIAPLSEDIYLSSIMKKNWMRIRGPPTSIYILRLRP